MGWDGAFMGGALEVQKVCSIDWACLFENLSNPVIWGPALYGVISTVVALTPTEKDDQVLARIKNLGAKVAHVVRKLKGRKLDANPH